MESSKALVINSFGDYDNIAIRDVELPPLYGKIEVCVLYGGLNFADLYTCKGLFMFERQLPLPLGIECYGKITAIGIENSEFKIGQNVFCYDYTGGLYRDKIRISPQKCFLAPDSIPESLRPAIFVNYLTAYFSLFDLGHLKKNETVLILSCAGGVGWSATQLAKTVDGVQIIGTTSKNKQDYVKTNGVDTVYTIDELEQINGELYDLIICNQSGNIFSHLQKQLKPLGRMVLIGANNFLRIRKFESEDDKPRTHVSLEELIMNSQGVLGLHLGILSEKNPKRINEVLIHIAELIKQNKLIPKIYKVLPMLNFVEAIKILANRENVGKVLIKMN